MPVCTGTDHGPAPPDAADRIGATTIEALRWLLIAAGALFAGGTFLSLSSHPHWFVRGWDFPRPQLVVVLVAISATYVAVVDVRAGWELVFLALMAAAIVYNCWRIVPYTPLVRPSVPPATVGDPALRLRLLICNVLWENDRADLLLRTIERTDPDLVLLVETGERWCERMKSLVRDGRYPHTVQRPQDNHYGMCLYSRLELIEPEILTLVDDDVPSIHTRVRLPCGVEVAFHGVHPRPPEPVHDQDSVQRDAELVLVAALTAATERPTIVAGDLNDVAWSDTTALFLRLSGMLDPRVGRGLYNTWKADSRWLRLPLDHVFHSEHFELGRLEILEDVGSDHFPVLSELHYRAVTEAEPEPPESGDGECAMEKLERARVDVDSTLPARLRQRLAPEATNPGAAPALGEGAPGTGSRTTVAATRPSR